MDDLGDGWQGEGDLLVEGRLSRLRKEDPSEGSRSRRESVPKTLSGSPPPDSLEILESDLEDGDCNREELKKAMNGLLLPSRRQRRTQQTPDHRCC